MPDTDPAAFVAAAPMTPEAIRQLDGPGLTRLAASLGLMPDGLQLEERSWRDRHRGYLWEPHENLAQADEVFRSLRTRGRGYTTRSFWYEEGQGSLSVMRDEVLICSVGYTATTEAHALLLCTVLTIAHEREA